MTEQPLRLLLVDDETSLREPLAKHLSQAHGYQVETAADAQAALARLEETRGQYHVALIDDLLSPVSGSGPEPSGVGLTTEIKARYPWIEVIVFTGWGMQSALPALQAGAYRYLAKPFNLEELGLLIQTAAEHSHLKSAAREKQILEQLMETSTALLRGQSLPEVLQIILEGVQAIGFDRVRLYLLSEDHEMMVGQAQVGMETEFVGLELPVAQDLNIQELIADPRPRLFEREVDQAVPYEHLLAKEGVNQWACVPLAWHEKIIGKISMDNKFSRRLMIEGELGPVALFASLAAAAIENTRLRMKEREATAKANQRARNLEAVQEVSTVITSLMTLEKTLEAICRAAVELFGVEHSGLVLFEADLREGQVVAEYPALGTRGLKIPVEGVPVEEQLVGSQQTLTMVDTFDPVSLGPVWDIFNRFNIRSALFAPVLSKGRMLGSFSLDAIGEPRAFTPDEIEQCQIFAAQVAVAVENARLFEQMLQERNRSDWLAEQLLALHAITRKMQSELDLPNLLNLISQLAAELLKADAAGILLLDEAQTYLSFQGAYGLSQQIVAGTRDKVGVSIAGRVVETGMPIIANNLPDDLRFFNPAAKGEGLLAVVSTPLWARGEIIGTLDIHSKSKLCAFGPDDLQILSLLAHQAAIAIENARLFQQTSRRALTLEALHQTALDITNRYDVSDLVKSILERAVELLEAKGGGVYLLEETGTHIKTAALSNLPESLVGKQVGVEEGVLGRVIKSRGSFFVPDYRSWSHRLRQYDPYRFTAVAGVPITWQDKIWGVITVHDDIEDRTFSAEGMRLLSHFGNLAAVALQNAALVATDKDKLRRLEQLSLANSEIMGNLGTMPLEARLNLISAHAAGILEAETCAIFLVNRPGFLSLEASHGHREGFFEKGREFAIQSGPGSGLVGHVASEGELFNAGGDVLTNHPAGKKGPYHGSSPGHYSMLAIPLKQKRKDPTGELIGLLRADNKRDGQGQAGPLVGFSREDEWILSLFADAVVVAIEGAGLVAELSEQKDHLARLVEITERRGQLLTALDEASRHIRAEKETSSLLQKIVRLATDLMGGTAGGLYVNHPHLKLLELSAVYELPADFIGSQLPHGQDLMTLVAQSGLPQVVNDYLEWPNRSPMFEPYGFKTMMGIPLKQAGEVEALLFIADSAGERQPSVADIEILVRFAAQASLALQTSRLLSLEQRRLGQLTILHRIGDYIQAAHDLNKIVHAALTGITAGYGLEFNRAALFLLDERQEYLIGEMGIGHVNKSEAEVAWIGHKKRGLEDFGRYLDLLEGEGLPLTPIGKRIQGLQLPLAAGEGDLFSQVIQERHCILVDQAELDRLPQEFTTAFEPALPLIVVPLVARDQAIGLLVADNKIIQSPITPEDIETLLTFTNTVAVTIDNVRLLQEATVERERLRSLYEASNALVLSQDPEQVLRDIVERARLAAAASEVSMVLIDEINQARSLITLGTDESMDIQDFIRPDGLSMQVMRTGQPEILEDTTQQRDRVNPSVFWRKIAAALCLPVSLEGRRIGVMWVHYNQPRRFSKSEIEALQLYVNQTAITYDSVRRMKELNYLHRAAEALAGLAEVQEVFEQIVQSAQEVLQADSAVICPYDAIRDKFILDRAVMVHIPAKVWSKFQKVGPRQGGTAYTVMQQGWIGVTDVDDREQYGFIGEATRGLLKAIEARSFQGIALTVDEEKLGVLYVNYNHLRSFSDAERDTAQTFANYAALALKKARLFDQTSKARNAARVVAGVTALENLNRTLHSVVEGTIEAINCDAVTLYVYNQDKDKLDYPPTIAGVQHRDQVFYLSGVPAHSVVFTMLKQDRPYIVDNVATDPLFKDTRFAVEEQIKSCIAIPLQVGPEKVGVMFINYRQLHHFNHDDEFTNIALFAHQAAVAIRNAQFYEQLQRRARALQALYEAGQVVTGSLNLEKILFSLAEQAWRLIGTSHCCHLARLNGNELTFVAAYPLGQLAELRRVLGNIDLTKSNPVGVTGRAALTGQSQRVGDVHQDPDYIKYNLETRSELVVPIKVEDKVIGIIDVEHVEYKAFSEEDQRALEALAAQAAIAIQNATLFEETQRRAGLLDAAAKVARDATAALEINELLNETVRLISKHFGFYHVGVFLLDGDRQYAVLRATYPENNRGMLKRGHRLRIGKEGIIGFVAQEGKLHFAPDVKQDKHHLFNPLLPHTRAEMVFPLSARGEIIGALDVQSTQVVNLKHEDAATLQIMADQLANAIYNAQQYEELKQTKGLVGARTAVAWMGIVSATWRHAIEGHALTIKEEIDHLRTDVPKRSRNKIEERLTKIQRMAQLILDKPITPPLSTEEGVEPVPVSDLLRERLKQLWENEPYQSVRLNFDNLNDPAIVRASPAWLLRAFDVLLDNAVEAMANSIDPLLTVSARVANSHVELVFADTGRGISKDVLVRLFNQQIKKPVGARGLGMGLLMAQTIAQTYGGKIQVEKTGQKGTTIVVSLPRETKQGE